MPQFKIGDVVKLKSGGPRATVDRANCEASSKATVTTMVRAFRLALRLNFGSLTDIRGQRQLQFGNHPEMFVFETFDLKPRRHTVGPWRIALPIQPLTNFGAS